MLSAVETLMDTIHGSETDNEIQRFGDEKMVEVTMHEKLQNNKRENTERRPHRPVLSMTKRMRSNNKKYHICVSVRNSRTTLEVRQLLNLTFPCGCHRSVRISRTTELKLELVVRRLTRRLVPIALPEGRRGGTALAPAKDHYFIITAVGSSSTPRDMAQTGPEVSTSGNQRRAINFRKSDNRHLCQKPIKQDLSAA